MTFQRKDDKGNLRVITKKRISAQKDVWVIKNVKNIMISWISVSNVFVNKYFHRIYLRVSNLIH